MNVQIRQLIATSKLIQAEAYVIHSRSALQKMRRVRGQLLVFTG